MKIKQDYLMGYKGQSFMDSGYVYAPYFPLMQTPQVDDQVLADRETYVPKSISSKFRNIFEDWESSNSIDPSW